MAGSRVEKIGTIFLRVRGLLRSGALLPEDKPIWYDVYEAFPPKDPPSYKRSIPQHTVVNMLYPEDLIRAQFYKKYMNPDVVDLTNENVKTSCQKFVEMYMETLEGGQAEGRVFESTAESLKYQGIRLLTGEEFKTLNISKIGKEPGEKGDVPLTRFSVKDVFGSKVAQQQEMEDEEGYTDSDTDNSSDNKR